MRPLVAQFGAELRMTLRRGESVLLTLGIPVVLLGFFSSVDVLPTGRRHPVDFLFPGILALAVMSSSLVSVAIATGFERENGVLKRLGSTPLGRPRLLAAKTAAVVAVQLLQFAVLSVEAVLLGYGFSGAHGGVTIAAIVVATVAFVGVAMLMAGTLPALTTLAAANGLYVVLLLLSGMLIPFSRLPSSLASIGRLLPSGALSEALGASLAGSAVPGRAWIVLVAWAVTAPALAAWRFRWQ